ncbi:MAG: hypothetical protein HZB36_07390 [Candidatus Omnitrophica bacterium]|nr:hypothetical protein [Candidatus Omnitrophota bacterium]
MNNFKRGILFFVLSSFFALSTVPVICLAGVTYTKAPLYKTGSPYIKYFIEKTVGVPPEFKGLTRSYMISLGGLTPGEEALINYGSWAYDQTILGTIALDNADTTILDTYVAYFKQLTDPNNPLFATTSAFNVKNGTWGVVRILGRNVANWWNTWDWSVDTGATACLIEYALCAYQKTLKLDYKNLAVLLGSYLLALQDVDGGIRFAPIGVWNPQGLDVLWKIKSTEQNERALYAFEALYQITQDVKYSAAVTSLKKWLINMYDKTTHLYRAAATFNGTTWVKSDSSYMPTDVTAFASLSMMFADSNFGSTQQARDAEIDAMFGAIEQKTAFFDNQNNLMLFRFTPVQPGAQTGDYGSVEWSAQMALAYLRAAQNYAQRGAYEKAQAYLNKYNVLVASLEAYFIIPADDLASKIAPYASYYLNKSVAGGVPTGTGHNTLNCQAALASVYFVFAKTGYDPTKLDGGPGVPVIQNISFTPPIQPAVADNGQYTASVDQLYASWSSFDPESGIAEYQYKITQDSATGTVVRNWTSAGKYIYVTAGNLALQQGKTYFFSVKAKNGAGLWSSVGYSDGITVTRPDLTIFNIYSDVGKLSIKIGNIGKVESPLGQGHLYIYIDGTLKWTYGLSTLANQSFRQPAGVTVVQPQVLSGTHKIRAVIDPLNKVIETNENNNTLEKDVVF